MDLLCITPMYDRYLCKALQARNPLTVLGAISFHLDVNYFNRFGVHRQPGLLDCVAKLRLRSNALRQGLKAIEYIINLLNLFICFTLSSPEVIHVQWIPLITKVPLELWFLRVLKKRGIRLVYTVHNILPHDTGMKYKDTFRVIYNLMDALICHTQNAKEQLVKEFGISADKVWVIPHGPMFHDSIQIKRVEACTRLGYRGEETNVLAFGGIRPYKGLEFLLQAWKLVIDQCPDTRLIIAGNGDKDYLRQIVELINDLELEQSVQTHFGFIPNDELPIFHSAADILVYPYRNITQSGALFTGMAFGKPIVATDVGGFKETLRNGETGVLIEYGNVQQLANNLINLIQKPEERKRLGRAAFEELDRYYSWEAIAEKTLECYKALF